MAKLCKLTDSQLLVYADKENKQLKITLEERDSRIAELEKEVESLNRRVLHLQHQKAEYNKDIQREETFKSMRGEMSKQREEIKNLRFTNNELVQQILRLSAKC